MRHRCGIVIDLRATDFLGACALGPIACASALLRAQGAGVTVVVGKDLHKRLLAVTGVDSLVAIDDGNCP